MIYIALGANLTSDYGTPAQTLYAAIEEMSSQGLSVIKISRIWLTAPVPLDPDQDWFHNAVVAIETEKNASEILDIILSIEKKFGRVRTAKNAPRVLDLDLIAYHDEFIREGNRLIVPHPRMHERLFVLNPLQDIAKNWVHPETGRSVHDLIELCPPEQEAHPLECVV